MKLQSLAAFEARLADRLDIRIEIAFLLRAIDARSPKKPRVLPAIGAAALVLAASNQALAQQVHHVVVAGESLYRIAQRELGSGARWQDIARLNHLANPSRIRIGKVLAIPARRHIRVVSGHGYVLAHPLRPAVTVIPEGAVVAELPPRRLASAKLAPKTGGLPWKALDLLALGIGAAWGVKVVAKRIARPVAAPAKTALGGFWDYVPASKDLRNLEASSL